MKCCITGHTRGIGKVFYDHFTAAGWEVVGFDRTTSLSTVVEQSAGCDLFINNAYANGDQLRLFNQLYASVGKMIVCGSVASDRPDPTLPEYSKHKKDLQDRVLDVATDRNPNNADILLLKLTSSSYQDHVTVLDTVDFWLKHPTITIIGFNII
jgi:NAD(P)-dependent dehydrogenase (short-subunit alcohol dehydrogenase family)